MNYKKSKNYIFPIIEHVKSNNMKIIISLEDNYLRDNLSKDCIILKEPVEDIYSLMKYSLFVISSGDTMARESCLLGTPCIYTGGRGMLVNKELLEIGAMFKEDNIEEIIGRIDYILENNLKDRIEKLIKYKIENEWEDTTEVILKQIYSFIK